MTGTIKQRELQELIDLLREDQLDEPSASALCELLSAGLLSAGDGAIDQLARNRMLEVQLEMEFGGRSSGETTPQYDAPRENAEPQQEAASPVLSTLDEKGFLGNLTQLTGDFVSRTIPLSYFIAFIVLAGGLGLLAMVSWPIGDPAPVASRNESPPPALLVAHLGRTRDLQWAGQRKERPKDSRLFSGEVLEIERGSAEILFASGAQLIVAGPAKLRLDSKMAVHLSQGQVSAFVPPRAHGFMVDSPVVTVIDRGTDFEVSVGLDETAGVRVYAGKVDVQLKVVAGRGRKVRRLIAGESARFDARAGDVQVRSDVPERHVRHVRRFASLIAKSIEIKNPSFEFPEITTVGHTALPQQWQTTSDAGKPLDGTFSPGPECYSSPIPDGQQIGYVRPGNTLDQTLKQTFAADQVYELTVRVGARADNTTPVRYAIDLLAGQELLSSVQCGANEMVQPDHWVVARLKFHSRAGRSYVGRPITIRLRGHTDSPGQINFDDVRLISRSLE